MKRVAIVVAAVALATAGAAVAQPLPTNRSDLAYSFAPLVKRVSPAVVNIYTTTTARVRRLPFPIPGMPQEGQRVQNSLGSGVLVKADGLIVTNAHVVKGAEEIRVVLADRREFDAKLITQDERYDLALLHIDTAGEKFPFLEMRDSDSIEVGDVVLAIGNPFGLNQTVTSGIISALARSAGGINDSSFFIQTDAAINPGNSGGALVSLDGRLIGINTAIYSQTGGSVGIGFATPSNIVARVVTTGEAGGRIVRPWLGITMQRVTPDIASGLGLARPAGLVVKDVYRAGEGDPRRQGDHARGVADAAARDSAARQGDARRPPSAERRHRGQHVARHRRRARPDRVARRGRRRGGPAGLLFRPFPAAGRHDHRGQRPAAQDRRRPQGAHRLGCAERQPQPRGPGLDHPVPLMNLILRSCAKRSVSKDGRQIWRLLLPFETAASRPP
jgi:serine protease Do